MRRNARASSITVALLGLAWNSSSSAFCRTTTCDTCAPPPGQCVSEGAPLFWPVNCVSYDVQQNASRWANLAQATAAADLAFGAWTAVECDTGKVSLTISDNGPVACDKHEYNDQQHSYGGNANIIIFRDTNWVDTDNPNASTLAITTVTFNRSTGEIYDADIEVNGTNAISTSPTVPDGAYDLQSILTHEAGHFFGLAHSTIACSSDDCPTMNAIYRQGSIGFRTLEADDKSAICTVYPPERMATDNACLPRHGFSPDCGGTASKGCCSTALGGAHVGGREASFAALLGLGLLVLRGRRA